VAANAARFENRLNIALEINFSRFLRAADSPENAHRKGGGYNYLSQFISPGISVSGRIAVSDRYENSIQSQALSQNIGQPERHCQAAGGTGADRRSEFGRPRHHEATQRYLLAVRRKSLSMDDDCPTNDYQLTPGDSVVFQLPSRQFAG
jgi:hypothetical protein